MIGHLEILLKSHDLHNNIKIIFIFMTKEDVTLYH
jgi:hypothetical protein